MATEGKRSSRSRRKFDASHAEETLPRQLPSSVPAEVCVLGSILLWPDAMDDVLGILRADDFFDPANRLIFESMQAVSEGGRKIDHALLVEDLKKKDALEQAGGIPHLFHVAQSVPTAANAQYYAEIVRESSSRRSLIEACTEVLRDAYDSSFRSIELLSAAEQRIFAILEGRTNNNIHEISDVLTVAMDRIDARMRGEHQKGSVQTGFIDMDNLTGGLHGSELIILAARPSMGKTAFAMNIAENVALQEKAPVLFVSLEMSATELADRLLCSVAKVNGHHLRNGTISKQDRERLVEKAGIISSSPLFVDDSPSRTVTEIAAAARRIRRRTGALGLIVIDYLQLIEPDNSRDPRQEQVAKIARRLKGLARELDVPVLCLAQLNRQAEVSKENRPRLSHLRESGAIEQDADVVMFVHREEYYRTPEEREEVAGQAEIIIAKQRNGPIGDIDLLWQKEFTRFVNPAKRAYDDFEQFNDPNADPF
ncbi:MAG: replicative DNA helicase [Pirellulaceae bacterium]|nr:replicative DNA helicase [Planctomycetales bacterium]